MMGYILTIFVWAVLIGNLICIPINKGIIWEEFILSLQLIFLHCFIYSEYLPATIKTPLKRLQRIEDLNIFLPNEAKSLETTFVGNIVQDSPLRFTQHQTDINFTRAVYAIIIVNIFYLCWFLLNLGLYQALRRVDQRNYVQERIKNLTSRVATRKINYFDQIWRYQFVSIIWAFLLQSYNFNYPEGTGNAYVLNMMLCIASLLFCVAWPIFVLLYTMKQKDNL